MSILGGIGVLWRKLRRRRRLRKVIWVESREKLPACLGSSIYVVGQEKAKWVVIDCPCGCGERIDVNLMATRIPAWKFSVDGGQVTLWPSLWLPQDKCGSHFWIKRNRIIWV